MKTEQEIRKMAKKEFDALPTARPGDPLAWSIWKAAYYSGYRSGEEDSNIAYP